jgi:hypothetical protein
MERLNRCMVKVETTHSEDPQAAIVNASGFIAASADGPVWSPTTT